MVLQRVKQFLLEFGANVNEGSATNIVTFVVELAGEKRLSWVNFEKAPFLEFVFFMNDHAEDYLEKVVPYMRDGLDLVGSLLPLDDCMHYTVTQAITPTDCDHLLRHIFVLAANEIGELDRLVDHGVRIMPSGRPEWAAGVA